MRARIFALSALVFAAVFLCFGQARSQEAPLVIPGALSQIQDDQLRESLSQYAPDYDSLSAEAQVTAYTIIHRTLYQRDPAPPQTTYYQPQPAPQPYYQPQPAPSHQVFVPARPYDPKIDVPVHPYSENPEKYTRYWDASKYGGTGRYEPWRDPMWTPAEEWGGVLGRW